MDGKDEEYKPRKRLTPLLIVNAIIWGTVVIVVLVFAMKGWSQKTNGSTSSSPTPTLYENILTGKIYWGHMNPTFSNDELGTAIKFSPDGVVEWVRVLWGDTIGYDAVHGYDKYYGTYELDDRKLSITITNMPIMTGVVQNLGNKLALGNAEFNAAEDLSADTLRQFD